MEDLYKYLKEKFLNGEVFFLSEIPDFGMSKETTRKKIKKLLEEGKIEKIQPGTYFIPFITIFGTKGSPSINSYIEKKYLRNDNEDIGYITGLQVVNAAGLTSQNSAYTIICSNNATTKYREETFKKRKIIIYKPFTQITSKNKSAMQFLDLMLYYPKYAEITGEEAVKKIKAFAERNNVDYTMVKRLADFYPDKIYKNLYKGGIMNELV